MKQHAPGVEETGPTANFSLSLSVSLSTASEACASAEVRAAAPVCARSRSSFSQVLRRTSGRARASQGPARTRIRVDFLARGSSCRLFSPTLPYRLLLLISLAPHLLSFSLARSSCSWLLCLPPFPISRHRTKYREIDFKARVSPLVSLEVKGTDQTLGKEHNDFAFLTLRVKNSWY